MELIAGLDWGALALKAAITAAIVVSASLIAERSRPFVAAIVLSLPISAGPAYILLALQHDASFIARASAIGFPTQIATATLVLVHAALARAGVSTIVALLGALAGWAVAAAAIALLAPNLGLSLLLLVMFNGILLPLTWSWRQTPASSKGRPRWFDVPLRAGLVALMVVSVVTLSNAIGPAFTGTLAAFPVSYFSFILLMHRRLGGVVVASAMTQGLFLLIGFTAGLGGLHLLAAAGFKWAGIGALLALPVVWSLAVVWWTYRRATRIRALA